MSIHDNRRYTYRFRCEVCGRLYKKDSYYHAHRAGCVPVREKVLPVRALTPWGQPIDRVFNCMRGRKLIFVDHTGGTRMGTVQFYRKGKRLYSYIKYRIRGGIKRTYEHYLGKVYDMHGGLT